MKMPARLRSLAGSQKNHLLSYVSNILMAYHRAKPQIRITFCTYIENNNTESERHGCACMCNKIHDMEALHYNS